MRVRLRQYQWKAAAAGDRTMLIWLGKQELGQTDKQAMELTGANGEAIQVSVVHQIIDPRAP